jgi:hypothetical protein
MRMPFAFLIVIMLAVAQGGFADDEKSQPEMPKCAPINSLEADSEEPSARLECRISQFRASTDLEKRVAIAAEIDEAGKDIFMSADSVRVTDSTVDDLAAMLNDDDDTVRGDIAACLGWIGARAQRAVPALLRAADRALVEQRIPRVVRTTSGEERQIALARLDSAAPIGVALERITGRPANSFAVFRRVQRHH